MLDALIRYQARNLDYAKRLTADLTDAQWCAQPSIPGAGKVTNHAAWVLGHLLYVAEKTTLTKILGQPNKFNAAWEELFHGKSQPSADGSKYPSKATLIAGLEDAYSRIAAALKKCDASILSKPTPAEMGGFAQRFPTIADALIHLMAGHEQVHLGQVSAWRRAQGLPAV